MNTKNYTISKPVQKNKKKRDKKGKSKKPTKQLSHKGLINNRLISSYDFGGFMGDMGKTLLNNVASPVEAIAGRNFYDPEFEGQAFEEVNNVYADGVIKGATDVAGTYFLGPTYGMAKQGIQMGVNAADPNQKLDKTNPEDMNTTSAQVGQGISQLGGMASSFIGGNPMQGSNMNQLLGNQLMAGGGKMTHYKGETHQNGGIQVPNSGVEVEDKETNYEDYVFSDRLKVPKSHIEKYSLPKSYQGKTFAEVSKMIDKKSPREDDALDKATKDRMLDRLTTSHEEVRMAKMDKLGQQMMAYGGKYKKADGGNFNPPYGYTTPAGQMTYEDMMRRYTPEEVDILVRRNLDNPYDPNLKTIDSRGIPANTAPDRNLRTDVDPNAITKGLRQQRLDSYAEPKSYEVPKASAGYEAMRMVPIAANLISGMNYDKLNANNYNVNSQIEAPTYNVQPQMDQIDRGFSTTRKNIQNASAGNAGTYLSNLTGAMVGRNRSVANLYNQKENIEGQNQMAADQANLRTDMFNAQNKFRVDDFNFRSKAASRDMLREAASQVGQVGDARIQDDLMRKYIQGISPNFYGQQANGGYFYNPKK